MIVVLGPRLSFSKLLYGLIRGRVDDEMDYPPTEIEKYVERLLEE
jgi:hypothetical protein